MTASTLITWLTGPAVRVSDLLGLFGHLLLVSPLALGGVLAVAPDVRRVMVSHMGIITDTQFNASIALAQAAPGPNVLFVAALGWQAAGVVGAAVALAGILLPSSLLTFVVARWGQARREWRSIRAFKTGMAPIVVALVFSSAWTLVFHTADWRTLLCAGVVAVVAWRTRVHVVLLVAAGAAVGALGWV